MIIEYHRPQTIEDALKLLSRKHPITVPLGGGTKLNRPTPEHIAAVDLQALRLNSLEQRGQTLIVGAAATLQGLIDHHGLPDALTKAIRHETTYNLRQVSTVAGTLVAADGRSPFTTAMLALDVSLLLLPGEKRMSLGDFLPLRADILNGSLITQIKIPVNTKLAYQYIARSPADQPIVCVTVAQWKSGRTRVVLGGFGKDPTLVMDGPDPDGAETAVRDVHSHVTDQWASAEYRREVAGILTLRCLREIEE